jgi:hypothetical protein
MLQRQTISPELFHACETIFGHDVKVSHDFLESLQSVGVKTAFRKKALETHPDRAVLMSSLARDLHAEFIDVRVAYEKLLFFVNTKQAINPNDESFRGSKTQKTSPTQRYHPKDGDKKSTYKKTPKRHSDHFHTGYIPKANLMFGQFLYYSGLISWQMLIEAICWQRRQRPLIGQIAVAWELLSTRDVRQILDMRSLDEKFGECALRAGYISSFHQLALVGKQRQLQRPLGEFFIETGILSPTEISKIAGNQQRHNWISGR